MRGKRGVECSADYTPRIIPARAGQTQVHSDRVCVTADHPRACGANVRSGSTGWATIGSSPRVRGKRLLYGADVGTHRIIPARAGQTPSDHEDHAASPDHPRACGANSWSVSPVSFPDGSSPRVRGKRRVLLHGRARIRIIPARAGQTATWPSRWSPSADHPRACGANAAAFVVVFSNAGSSPRVRGKRPQPLHDTFRVRIIPARAGQTNSNSMWQREYADHPRACGANSSLRDEEPADTRIIPARAGQTVLFCPQFVHLPDHPRACGANADIGVSTWGMIGSSPRVRGKPSGDVWPVLPRRIIPARAGQTFLLFFFLLWFSDHPRACGANAYKSRVFEHKLGSSPRVRGKHRGIPMSTHFVRIIPARAGQT